MRPGLAAKALSQNVWYGGCTEIAQPVVRNFLQRVALSQNSSFTGADNPENKTAKAWQFSRQTYWITVLVDLTNGGFDVYLSTSQGNGAEILSDHSISTKNQKLQKREFRIEFNAKSKNSE